MPGGGATTTTVTVERESMLLLPQLPLLSFNGDDHHKAGDDEELLQGEDEDDSNQLGSIVPDLSGRHTFCRLCLTHSDTLNPLFPPEDGPDRALLAQILDCVEVRITLPDDMRSLICGECVQQIYSFASFKELCKSNDKLLRSQTIFRDDDTDDQDNDEELAGCKPGGIYLPEVTIFRKNDPSIEINKLRDSQHQQPHHGNSAFIPEVSLLEKLHEQGVEVEAVGNAQSPSPSVTSGSSSLLLQQQQQQQYPLDTAEEREAERKAKNAARMRRWRMRQRQKQDQKHHQQFGTTPPSMMVTTTPTGGEENGTGNGLRTPNNEPDDSTSSLQLMPQQQPPSQEETSDPENGLRLHQMQEIFALLAQQQLRQVEAEIRRLKNGTQQQQPLEEFEPQQQQQQQSSMVDLSHEAMSNKSRQTSPTSDAHLASIRRSRAEYMRRWRAKKQSMQHQHQLPPLQQQQQQSLMSSLIAAASAGMLPQQQQQQPQPSSAVHAAMAIDPSPSPDHHRPITEDLVTIQRQNRAEYMRRWRRERLRQELSPEQFAEWCTKSEQRRRFREWQTMRGESCASSSAGDETTTSTSNMMLDCGGADERNKNGGGGGGGGGSQLVAS